MKIYNKVVISIATGETIFEDSFDYVGEVAKCGGDSPDVEFGKPAYSVAGQIVGSPGIRSPLTGALRENIITNPFTDQGSREYKQAVADIRGGYGARGLEGSGIAIQGEQKALGDIVAKTNAQRAQQLVGLLGTASGAPSFPGGTATEGSKF